MTFEDTLATWLVKQRWFAGKGRTIHDLTVVSDTEIIPGDPGLRHLLVTVSHGATTDCYEFFIGSPAPPPARPAAPARHAPARRDHLLLPALQRLAGPAPGPAAARSDRHGRPAADLRRAA